ncbi:DNA cytosine methyltransferase [Clostridium perfringens]|uniref:DNA cytosine methyltransferase n=1 Tax=Clostridium perfringens TaxID=1502 RepID=UPI0039938D05|nr:DNA cytosine methyltransferase [Clostridium perfringens]
MKKDFQKIYKLKKEELEKITYTQLVEFEKGLEKDDDGNIKIQYTHKGYNCNDKEIKFSDSDIQAISFFSGCGGLDIGAQLAGVKVISSLDFYEDSVETLKANKFFDHSTHLCEDISNVSGKDFENLINKNNPKKLIILGGPPCQPFSKAGYWVKNENRKGHDDPRNMIGEYLRLISEIMPDGFVLENVESILHQSNKPAVDFIISETKRLGYNYSLLRVNSADYGLPQKRKRVFFLASKNEINANLKKTHGSEKEILKNPELLPYESVINWIGDFDKKDFYDSATIVDGKYSDELKCIPPGKNYIALSEKAGHPEPKFIAGKRYWSSLLKLHPNMPSWTIIASPGHWEGPFHWNNRRLTIKEAAAIQTFPDDYVFVGSIRSQRKQIGNAVPPLLGKLVVEELCRWI